MVENNNLSDKGKRDLALVERALNGDQMADAVNGLPCRAQAETRVARSSLTLGGVRLQSSEVVRPMLFVVRMRSDI